jgi:hypothetical protein
MLQSVQRQATPAHQGRRRAQFILAAAALTLATVFAQPGVAQAATVLSDGQWVNPFGTDQPANTDYSVTTTGPYWSVVFLRNGYIDDEGDVAEPARYSLRALDSTGAQLASSNQGIFPSFAAIDGNIRSAQTYTARVVRNYPEDNTPIGEQYGLTFQDGKSVLPSGRSYLTVPTGKPDDKVYVRDVYLNANTISTINFTSNQGEFCPRSTKPVVSIQAYLLASDPAKPASAVQDPQSALDHSDYLFPSGTACEVQLAATISRSAWYGVVLLTTFQGQIMVDVNSVPSNTIS